MRTIFVVLSKYCRTRNF